MESNLIKSDTTAPPDSYAELVGDTYRQKQDALVSFNRIHRITVDLDKYDVNRKNITFKQKDIPYFKLALVDRHLDEIDA